MHIHIGERGRADTPMSPQGKVTIGGLQYDARTEGRWVEPGAEVYVVKGDHLGLIVCPIDAGTELPPLPDLGQPVKVAAWHKRGDQSAAELERERRQEERARSVERRYGLQLGVGAGGLAGLLTVLFGFGGKEVEAGQVGYGSLLSAGAVVGLSWGAIVFSTVYHGILDGRRDFGKLIYYVLVLALGGGVAGALFGYHTWGLHEGVACAFLGSLLLGGLIPVGVMLLQIFAEPEIGEGGGE
jgi:hypothetical protein